ncbi:hypothetical protein LOAG_01647 [Loa loa]|uniref:Uncharacterized protein n=1 Tax=Loa loa TaxID=7209 RepID=A0A1S0U8Q4_LOALO|nr:hypothetical protein LOAG_01647 [Loa loa]EFO26837.1 hypothetical protein LOAG_01647 [Loa loa]
MKAINQLDIECIIIVSALSPESVKDERKERLCQNSKKTTPKYSRLKEIVGGTDYKTGTFASFTKFSPLLSLSEQMLKNFKLIQEKEINCWASNEFCIILFKALLKQDDKESLRAFQAT